MSGFSRLSLLPSGFTFSSSPSFFSASSLIYSFFFINVSSTVVLLSFHPSIVCLSPPLSHYHHLFLVFNHFFLISSPSPSSSPPLPLCPADAVSLYLFCLFMTFFTRLSDSLRLESQIFTHCKPRNFI